MPSTHYPTILLPYYLITHYPFTPYLLALPLPVGGSIGGGSIVNRHSSSGCTDVCRGLPSLLPTNGRRIIIDAAVLHTLRKEHYTTMLYCTILHYTTLYYTILYYTVLYYTVLYCTNLYLYYTIL